MDRIEVKTSPVALAEPLEQVDRVFVRVDGRKLIYFGGCDYFRLASHPAMVEAAADMLKEGLNIAASRVTTGNHPVYERLELALARFFKTQESLLVPTGYVGNLIVAQAFAGQFSHAIIDERAHPSLKDATRFLDCPVFQYKHRDTAHAGQTIARCGPGTKIILLTDGVFAHDGTLAPLPDLLKALPQDAVALLDDAHGAGVLGKNGRGTVEYFGISDPRIVRAITLSKAFGAYGGAVLADKRLRAVIISRSEIFIGSTPLPLPMAAAALKALSLLGSDRSLRGRLNANLKRIGKDVPIISIAPKTPSETERLKKRLLKAGVFPSFIRYPSGPASGYFRFAISSEHTPEQIQSLLGAIQV